MSVIFSVPPRLPYCSPGILSGEPIPCFTLQENAYLHYFANSLKINPREQLFHDASQRTATMSNMQQRFQLRNFQRNSLRTSTATCFAATARHDSDTVYKAIQQIPERQQQKLQNAYLPSFKTGCQKRIYMYTSLMFPVWSIQHGYTQQQTWWRGQTPSSANEWLLKSLIWNSLNYRLCAATESNTQRDRM